jgi:HSP20 family protein
MDTSKPVRAEATAFPLLRQFGRDVDWLFDRLGWNAIRPQDPTRAFWTPELEVLEGKNEFIVRMDVPGLKKKDVTIEITEQELLLRGERMQQTEEHGDRFFRTERSYGAFSRTVPLPESVKIDQAKASVLDGVLEVRMPMSPREEHRRRLEIQDAAGEKTSKHMA